MCSHYNKEIFQFTRRRLVTLFALLSISSFFIGACFAQLLKNDPLVIDGITEDGVKLYVQNGCSNYYVIFSNDGSVADSIPPTIGMMCNPFYTNTPYSSKDTLFGESSIRAVVNVSQEFGYALESDTTLFFVATDSNLYVYEIFVAWFGSCTGMEMTRIDSLPIRNIRSMDVATSNYTGSSLLLILDTPDSTAPILIVLDLYTMTVKYQEVLNGDLVDIDATWNTVYIIGSRGDSIARLYELELDSFEIVKTIDMSLATENPVSMRVVNNKVHLLSFPGNSKSAITQFSLTDSSESSSIFYSQSTCKAYDWSAEGLDLYCQPASDPIGNTEHKKLYKVNPSLQQITSIIDIDMELYAIQYPNFGGFSSSWLFLCNSDSNSLTTVYASGTTDSLVTSYNTRFVNHEIRCAFALQENLKDYVRFHTFPNPVSDDVNLVVSGVPSNGEYEVSILDIQGRLLHREQVKSKSTAVFSFADYEPGIYFLQIVINGELFAQKIVKN